MRIAAFAVILCLLVSPAALAGDQVVFDVKSDSLLSQLWEALKAIPAAIGKVAKNEDSSTAGSNADAPIEPPEGNAGPMVIVNG